MIRWTSGSRLLNPSCLRLLQHPYFYHTLTLAENCSAYDFRFMSFLIRYINNLANQISILHNQYLSITSFIAVFGILIDYYFIIVLYWLIFRIPSSEMCELTWPMNLMVLSMMLNVCRDIDKQNKLYRALQCKIFPINTDLNDCFLCSVFTHS